VPAIYEALMKFPLPPGEGIGAVIELLLFGAADTQGKHMAELLR